MDFKSYDFKKVQELLENNKPFFDSFFGHNPFDDDFFKKVTEDADVASDVKPANKRKDNGAGNGVDNINIPMDMINRGHELHYIFEIPGLSKEDIKIKFLDSSMILEGEIRRQYVVTELDETKFERRIGSFLKKVVIPVMYDSKRVRAKYFNGLLEIRIPILKRNNFDKVAVQFPQADS